MKQAYSDELIKLENKLNKEELKIQIHILTFLISAGIDTCEIINEKYLQEYNKLKEGDNSGGEGNPEMIKKYNIEAPYKYLINAIESSLYVSLKGTANFNFEIDHTDFGSKNYVMFKYLESNIKAGAEVNLTKNDIEYIKKHCEYSENKSILSPEIDFISINKYLQYVKLQESLSHKGTKIKSKKI